MLKKITPLDDRLFTALVLSVIALAVTLSAVFTRLDFLHYDLGRYLSASPAPSDIVIVAIDERSLSEIGRWPWSRALHAGLVEKLHQAQAKVIGFDIIFAEPDHNQPEADIALAQAFQLAGNVVLPTLLEVPYIGAPVKLSQPTAHLADAAAGLGRVHVPLDVDGIARSFYLWEGLKTENGAGNTADDDLRRHFAQAVLAVAGQLPANVSSAPQPFDSGLFSVDFKPATGALRSQERRYVKFLGPPGHFQRISYQQVLNGQYPADFFKDKIVLVGATAAGLGDALPTPVSALSQPMPGVEFHANAIAGMRADHLVRQAPLWVSCLIVVALSILPLLFLPRLSPFNALCLVAGYYLLVTFVAIALPQYLNVWVPPAGALIAILLIYPVWSWRKLESAQVYLDQALKELQNELAQLGLEKASLASNFVNEPRAHDEMQSRINKVEITSQFLRESQQKRLDTLAFISHDIRAPLASAIMQLEEIEQSACNKPALRVTQMLNRALSMADEFLQSSRAEMVDTSKFSDIQVNGLLQETLDDAYTLAQSNHVRLNANLSEEPMWIQGNFGLLQRAIANILSNAIKYSEPNTAVQVLLTKVEDEMELRVTDTGPGIPPEKVNKLFKRFSRVEGEYQQPVGTGLGLYFVDVTIQKHHGRIFVESMLNEGTTFTIRLPLATTAFDA